MQKFSPKEEYNVEDGERFKSLTNTSSPKQKKNGLSLTKSEQTSQLLHPKPLDEMHAMELANHRMRQYLTGRYRLHGHDFGRWWYKMPNERKKEMLTIITDNTIPSKARSTTRRVPSLRAGDQSYSASVLSDWWLGRLLSHCKCDKHWFQDALVHELRYHLVEKRAEDIEYQLCVSLVMQGFVSPRCQDEQQFLRTPTEADLAPVHQLVHPEDPLHQEALASTKRTGIIPVHLKERVPFEVFLHRTWYRFSLFCLLFEKFDEYGLRMSPSNPLGKLRGCNLCKRECHDKTCVQCLDCKTTWWCSSRCRNMSIHRKPCSIGKPTSQTVLFG